MSSQPDASLSTDNAQTTSEPMDTNASSTLATTNPVTTTTAALTSRPDSQDTISHQQPPLPPPPPLSTSSPPPPEVSLKQEESADHPPRSGPSELYPVNALAEDDLDTDTDSAATEEDELNHEQESHRAVSSSNGRGNGHSKGTGGGGHHNNEDAELSLSSDNDDDEDTAAGHHNDDDYSNLPEETLCRWKDCGKVLPSIAALVVHLSDEHIGWKKTSYMCEWQGCSRRPIAQTTRFALISHMRSHTKHKPYDCPVPECDKSFSRSDAMAKHLKCQHGDVPERFTGRKSRGRYTMKDPAASSTLLHSSSFGAKKRRHHDGRSDAELSSSLKPAKMRKLGSGLSHHQQQQEEDNDPYGDRHHFHRTQSDARLLRQLNLSRKSGKSRSKGRSDHHHQDQDEEGTANAYHDNDHPHQDEDHDDDHQHDDHKDEDEYDEDAEDSDFAEENGQTPRERYGILKAKFQYIHNERESLESEYEETKKRLNRLRVERELLLDALLSSEDQYQDPALQDLEDSE
ncbi:unnamed protein product [Mortierella alpina]